jgi:hypothetical protein
VLQYLLDVSPPRCSHSVSRREIGVGIAYVNTLPLLSKIYFYLGLHPLLDFSPSVVHTLPWPWSLDMNHLKGFCNLVEKCMSTVVDFRLNVSPEYICLYIVDGNIVTHGDCSRFPNAVESGIPMSRSLCAL